MAKEPADRSEREETVESWVDGKSEEDLLADLRVFSAHLRDDPRNIKHRLRVAAIQLRLGRVDEAIVHYGGVVRGYVARGKLNSAIALCERILRSYPNERKVQQMLAALYARAPRDRHGSAVSPIEPGEAVDPEDEATTPDARPGHAGDDEDPIPLTKPKSVAEVTPPSEDTAGVVLLTRPKRK